MAFVEFKVWGKAQSVDWSIQTSFKTEIRKNFIMKYRKTVACSVENSQHRWKCS